MANEPTFSDEFNRVAIDAALALCDDGFIEIYDGKRPANAATPVGSQTLIATLRWNGKAFKPAKDGVAIANEIKGGTAVADGSPTWFRALKADGVSVLFDASAGAEGLTVTPKAMSKGIKVSGSSFIFVQTQA